jgi:hypothetical protein
MDKGGSRNGAFLSEEAQCSGPLGRAPLLGTLDTGISLCRGPTRETEGICLPGLLTKKDSISGFLSLDPEGIKILSLGAI